MSVILTFFILTQVGVDWIKRYPFPSEGSKVLYKDGYVYAGGGKHITDTTLSAIVIKYDTAGNLIGEYEYISPWEREAVLNDFVVDDSENIYAAVAIFHPDSGYDYGVIKFRKDGTLAWVFRYGELAGGDDVPLVIKIGKDGKIYVTGYIYGCCGANYDFFTVKLSPDGVKIWQCVYGYFLDSVDKATDMTIDENGNIWICGTTADSLGSYQGLVVIEYDTLGTTLFTDVYTPQSTFLYPNKIHFDGLGNIYVVGEYLRGNSDYMIVKYSVQGMKEWMLLYGESIDQKESAHSCGTDSSGNVYITGVSGDDIMTIKVTPDSEVFWSSRYDYAGGEDTGYNIKVDKFGNSYVVGWSENQNRDRDFITIHYGFCGAKIWETRYDGMNLNDYAYSLATGDTQDIYIIGTSDSVINDTIPNMVIIRYNEGVKIRENTGYSMQDLKFNFQGVVRDKFLLPPQLSACLPFRVYIYNKSGRRVAEILVKDRTVDLKTLNLGSEIYYLTLPHCLTTGKISVLR